MAIIESSLRTTLVILVLAVLSILAGLLLLPHLISWNDYRPEIEAKARALTGAEVEITGAVTVRFLPRPVLSLYATRLTAAAPEAVAGPPSRLAAERLDLGVSLPALLTGQLAFDRLDLIRPVVTLAPGELASRAALPVAWPFVGSERLRQVTVVGARVELPAAGAWPAYRLDELALTLNASEPAGGLLARSSFRLRGQPVQLRGELGAARSGGGRRLVLDLGLGEPAAPSAQLQLDGSLEQAPAGWQLAGTVAVSGPELRAASTALAAALAWPAVQDFGEAAAAFDGRGRLRLDAEGVALEPLSARLGEIAVNGQLSVPFGAGAPFKLDLALPSLALAELPPLPAWWDTALVRRLQTLPGVVAVQIDQLPYRDDVVRQARAVLTFAPGQPVQLSEGHVLLPGQADLRLAGRLGLADELELLTGRIQAVGDDLGASLAWLGLLPADPAQGLAAFSLSGELGLARDRLRLDQLDLRLDASHATGQAVLDLAARPHVQASLALDRLALDSYGAPGALRPLELARAAFRDLDATLDLKLERFSWQAWRLADLALRARVENRQLTLDQAALQAFEDSRLTLAGTLNLDTARLELNVDAASPRPGQVARRLGWPELGLLDRLGDGRLSSQLRGRADKLDLASTLSLGAAGQLKLEGLLAFAGGAPDYDLIVEGSHPDLEDILRRIGRRPLFVAVEGPAPLRLAGRLRRGGGEASLAGSVTFGPTSVTGRLVRTERRPRAHVLIEASIGNPQPASLAEVLALAGYRPVEDPLAPRALGSWSERPWPQAWLGALDGQLRLSAKGGMVGSQFELAARLDDRRLEVTRLAAELWDGKLAGRLSLDGRAEPPAWTVEGQLERVDAAALARWLEVPAGIEGGLDLQVKAESVGVTARQVMTGLAGEASVALAGGDLVGYEAARLRRALAPPPLPGSSGAPATALPTDRLPFRLDGRLGLKRGILEASGLAGELADHAAVLDGSIDLLLGALDLTLRLPEAGETTLRLIGPARRPQVLLKSAAQVGAEQPPAAVP